LGWSSLGFHKFSQLPLLSEHSTALAKVIFKGLPILPKQAKEIKTFLDFVVLMFNIFVAITDKITEALVAKTFWANKNKKKACVIRTGYILTPNHINENSVECTTFNSD